MFNVRPVTIAELFDSPNFADLCDEYRAESLRNPDMLGALPNREGYERMEAAGMLRPVGVFVNDELAGFCVVMIAPVLHYIGQVLATTESIFVADAHRSGGAGMALLEAAQATAVDAGARGLYVTAPSGGRLARLLPHVGYHETNSVFYRGLQ